MSESKTFLKKVSAAGEDDELIAVITAAIEAASMKTSTYNLNIKSIKRSMVTSPAWNAASREENIYRRI